MARPVKSWIFFVSLLIDVPQTVFMTSLVDILSNIPSPVIQSKNEVHPNSRKSYSSPILNENISGSADMTLGIPLYFGNFASESPIVLETASLPGSTLNGPVMYSILFTAVCTGIYDLNNWL